MKDFFKLLFIWFMPIAILGGGYVLFSWLSWEFNNDDIMSVFYIGIIVIIGLYEGIMHAIFKYRRTKVDYGVKDDD